MLEKLLSIIRKTGLQGVAHLFADLTIPFIFHLFKACPINKNKIVFCNFNGKGYGDNPKYICEEIRLRHPEKSLIWLIYPSNNNEHGLPTDIKQVPKYSLRAIYELSTASLWINNVRMESYVRKRKKQKYIQTWHGGFAFKKVEKDVTTTPNWYARCAKNDSEMADLFISNSKIQSNVYLSSFWYSGPILEAGYPRNDILISPEKRDAIKSKVHTHLQQALNLPNGKKLVLYAPTFRKDLLNIDISVEIDTWLTKLSSRFGGEWLALLRLHPNLNQKIEISELYDDTIIFDVSSYPDMQELLAVADVLITDYSSCMFDFGLSRRPCFLYTPDLENYILDDRGLYIKISETPFSTYKSNTELLEGISSFNEEEYQSRLSIFFEKYGSFEEGVAAKKVVDWIEETLF